MKDPQNEKWIAGVKEIDRELNTSVNQSQERLYEHQKPVMTMPAIVQQALDRCKLTYRHEGTVSDEFLTARELFVQSYAEDWHNTVKIVKPFSMTTGEGLVVLPDPQQQQQEGGITRHWEVESWRQSLGFTADDMWGVQEDVWFLRCLMQAIARVNEGTTELGNSRIKKINEAILRGGDLSDLKLRQAGNTGSKPGTTATRPSSGMHLPEALGRAVTRLTSPPSRSTRMTFLATMAARAAPTGIRVEKSLTLYQLRSRSNVGSRPGRTRNGGQGALF